MFKRFSDQRGFTLIEVLVVVVLLGILSSIAIPIFSNQQKDAKDAQIKSHLNALNISIASAKVSDINSLYPDELPEDADIRPSGSDFTYIPKNGNQDYCLRGEIIGSPYLYFTNSSGVIIALDNTPERRNEEDIAAAEADCQSDNSVKPVLLEGYLDSDQHGVLTWNNIDADSYNLRTISGDIIDISVSNDDASSHTTVRTDSPLTLRSVFIVEAFKDGGSSLSNEVTLSPVEMKPPTTNLYIKNITSLNAEGKTLEQIKADNGVAANEPLFHHFTPYASKATLYWDEVAWAREYIVFKNGVEIYRGMNTELEITADLNTINDAYFVRVGNNLSVSEDSNIVNFSGPIEGSPFLYTANRLNLTNLWTDIGKTETLLWTRVPGATSYEIYISSNNSNFTRLGTSTSQSLEVSLPWGTGSYYYYIRAVGADGDVNSNKVQLSREHPVMQPPVLTSTLTRNNGSALNSAAAMHSTNTNWVNAVRNNAGVNSTWTAVQYARSYEYQYRTPGGEWSSIITTNRQIPSLLGISPAETIETRVRAKGWGENYSPWGTASDLTRPVPEPVLVSSPTVRGRAVSNTNFIEGSKGTYACIPETNIQYKARNNANTARPLPSNNTHYVASRTAEKNAQVVADWYRSVGRDVSEYGVSDRFDVSSWGSLGWSTTEPTTPTGSTGQRVLEQWNYRCGTSNGSVSNNVEDTAYFKTPPAFNTPAPSGTVYQFLGMENPNASGTANFVTGMKNGFNNSNRCTADAVIETEIAYKYGQTGTMVHSINSNRWGVMGSSETPGDSRSETHWFTYSRANYTPNHFKWIAREGRGWADIVREGLHGNSSQATGYWHWEDTFNNRYPATKRSPSAAYHSAPVVFNSRCSNAWGDGDSQFEFNTTTGSYDKYNVGTQTANGWRVLRLDMGNAGAGYKVVPYLESFCRMGYPNKAVPAGGITATWKNQDTANLRLINNTNAVISTHLNVSNFNSKMSTLKGYGASNTRILEINPINRNNTEISSSTAMNSACARFTDTSYYRGSLPASSGRLVAFTGAHGVATGSSTPTLPSDLVGNTGPWALYKHHRAKPPHY